MRSRSRRGECQECGREFALRGDGTIRTHDAQQQRCPGSNQLIDSPPAISEWFGLSYSNFLVLHRVELEHMPLEWQHRFVRMLNEVNDAYDHLEHPDGYNVYPCRWVYVDELTEAEAEAAGVTIVHGKKRTKYYSANGDEMDTVQRVPIRVPDPIPHYRHGHVEPNLDATR